MGFCARSSLRKNLDRFYNLFSTFLCLACLAVPEAFAKSKSPAIPEEYETTGGHSLAFGGSTATAIGGMSAIRCNPALLALEKEYSFNGNYNWPTAGRDFYQLGVVDGKTSPIAAGFAYTGALDDYQGIATSPGATGSNDSQTLGLSKDTPMNRRASLAFGMPLGRMYVGFGSNYVEAIAPGEALIDPRAKKIKGFTMGFGAAAHLSPSVRLGFSAENLANTKLKYVSPTFYRAGASYFMGDVASVHIDYRRRDAVSLYEGVPPDFALNSQDGAANGGLAETLVNASTSIKVYDLLRLVLSSGRTAADGRAATQVAGGLSLINQKFNFSYQIIKRDLNVDAVHHALALGLDVAI